MNPRLSALSRLLPPPSPRSITARMRNLHWIPLFHLIWLYWMIASPWLGSERAQPHVVALTFLSLPLFLLLYWRAWFGDMARIRWNTGAMAALGLVMIPVNTSWSYVIYAAILIPHCARPRASLVWLALYMAAFYAVGVACGFSPTLTLTAVGMCCALSMLTLFGRLNRERDAELRLSHDEVRRLAATAERERIGRDLHDLLGHTLSLIAIKGELARRLFDRDAAAARHEVAEIERIAREALAQVRSAVTGIRAAGMAAELASARLLLESSGIALRYQSDEQLVLPADAETCLAMCLREAVTNVQRHAHATQVEIALEREAGTTALLSIVDDGRGGAAARGNGLAGIEERLKSLGGSLGLESPKGRGTRLSLRLPLGNLHGTAALEAGKVAATEALAVPDSESPHSQAA